MRLLFPQSLHTRRLSHHQLALDQILATIDDLTRLPLLPLRQVSIRVACEYEQGRFVSVTDRVQRTLVFERCQTAVGIVFVDNELFAACCGQQDVELAQVPEQVESVVAVELVVEGVDELGDVLAGL